MARKKAKSTKKIARKPAATKATAKKAAPKRAAAAAAVKKPVLKVGKSPLKKTEVFTYIAGTAELTRKDVAGVFDALSDVMHHHLRKAGPGEFTIPGLMKCKVQHKPATKARKGINPFTGEEVMFKAKPARSVVKIRPLKRLKEMAS
jgi:nucleoid DNA-binding protein